MAEHGLGEAPEGVRAEADCQHDHDEPAEPVRGDRPQCTLAVGRLPALSEGEQDREHADEAERDALREQPEAREPFDPRARRGLLGFEDGHGRVLRVGLFPKLTSGARTAASASATAGSKSVRLRTIFRSS